MDIYHVFADHTEETNAHDFTAKMRKFLDHMAVSYTHLRAHET